jgi:hypothetical protein
MKNLICYHCKKSIIQPVFILNVSHLDEVITGFEVLHYRCNTLDTKKLSCIVGRKNPQTFYKFLTDYYIFPTTEIKELFYQTYLKIKKFDKTDYRPFDRDFQTLFNTNYTNIKNKKISK